MSGDVAIQALIHLLVMPASVGVATWKARDKPARRFWPGFALTAIAILAAPAVLVKLGSGTDAEMWSFVMRIAAQISAAPILATVAGRLCRRIRSKVGFAAIVGATYVVTAVAGVAVVLREPSPRWLAFESTEGGFALEMPGAPECSPTRHETETATWHGIACRARIESPFDRFGGEVTFLVSSHLIPAELRGLESEALLRELDAPEKRSPSALLAGLQEHAAASPSDESLDSLATREILLAGVPAVQSHRSTRRGPPVFEAWQLRAVRGSRIYEMGLFGARSDLPSAWERMLRTFRFTEADAAPPPSEQAPALKGMTSTGGSVTVDGSTTAFRANAQTMTVDAARPVWLP